MNDETKVPASPDAPPAVPPARSTDTRVALSDGRVAVVRPPKGRDLERGALMAGATASQIAITMGVAAAVTTIDGKGITYEDVQDMPIADTRRLTDVVGNDLFPELATLLASLESRASGSGTSGS